MVHVGVNTQFASDGQAFAHHLLGTQIGVVNESLGGSLCIGPSGADGHNAVFGLQNITVARNDERSGAIGHSQVAENAPSPKARLLETGSVVSAVEVSEPFDRAWRRVGLALDRGGFTVEDRNRAQGIYFVRYVDGSASTESEPGLLSRMFGASKKDAKPAQYQIKVSSAEALSTLTVLNDQGQPDASPVAQRILKLLVQELQ